MKDGEHIEYYLSGEILSKSWYLDGKRSGDCIYYFRSGVIESKCNYLDGKLNGEYIFYYISVEISGKRYYINDIKVTESQWISYNRNLKLELLGL